MLDPASTLFRGSPRARSTRSIGNPRGLDRLYEIDTLESLLAGIVIANINSDLLDVLERKLDELNEQDRGSLVMMFDEVELRKQASYDARLKTLWAPHAKAQVAMIRSISSSFKLPCYYDYDTNMDYNLLIKLIRKIQSMNTRIRALVFDLGNHTLLKDLALLETKRHHIPNPDYPGKKIFLFPDPPHMIKLARNHWEDKGLGIMEGRKLVKFDAEELSLMMEEWDGQAGELQCLVRIKPSDVQATGAQRQNVGAACRIFSSSVANFLKLNGEPEKAAFVRCWNDWFDVLNSRYGSESVVRSCYGADLEAQDRALDRMLEV